MRYLLLVLLLSFGFVACEDDGMVVEPKEPVECEYEVSSDFFGATLNEVVTDEGAVPVDGCSGHAFCFDDDALPAVVGNVVYRAPAGLIPTGIGLDDVIRSNPVACSQCEKFSPVRFVFGWACVGSDVRLVGHDGGVSEDVSEVACNDYIETRRPRCL